MTLVEKLAGALRRFWGRAGTEDEDDVELGDWLRRIFWPPGRQRVPVVVAWLAGLACLVALALRFRLGTDVTDESFSIALPYRFALGDKPFVDELSIQQTTGILLWPFVFVFVKLNRGPTGIVIFFRVLLFVFKGLAAFSVYLAATRWLKSRGAAIAVAFVAIPFVQASIPNIGYNALSMIFVTAGTFLCAAAVSETGSRFWLLYFAGLCHGFAAFSYPPITPTALVATVLVFACMPNRRLEALGAFVAGGATAIALTLPSFRHAGIAGIKRSLGPYGGTSAVAPGDPMTKMKGVVEALSKEMSFFVPYAAIAAGFAAVLRARAVSVAVVGGCILAALLASHNLPRDAVIGSHTVIATAFFAPVLLVLARPDSKIIRGAALIIGPSVTAGLLAGFTSSQGPIAAAHALHATMVLSVLLAVRALEAARADSMTCLVPPLALTAALVVHDYEFVYRDGALATLTEPVKRGPFKGIRTTPERARAFEEYSRIIDRYDDPQGRTLVLYEAPGYFLFSKRPPGGHAVWEASYGDTDGVLRYWQQFTNGHSIVVQIKGSGSGVLDPVLFPRERLLEETPHFRVYRDR